MPQEALTITQRQYIFKSKPYTNCLNCIRTKSYLICEQCKQFMIDSIETKRKNQISKSSQRSKQKMKILLQKNKNYKQKTLKLKVNQKVQLFQFPLFQFHKILSSSKRKQLEQNFDGTAKYQSANKKPKTSNYDLWIKKVKNNKQESVERPYLESKGAKWPTKRRLKITGGSNLYHESKFENWQKKFLLRISQLQQQKQYHLTQRQINDSIEQRLKTQATNRSTQNTQASNKYRKNTQVNNRFTINTQASDNYRIRTQKIDLKNKKAQENNRYTVRTQAKNRYDIKSDQTGHIESGQTGHIESGQTRNIIKRTKTLNVEQICFQQNKKDQNYNNRTID